MTEATDIEAVRQANLAFYKAFETLDIDVMDGVWVRDDTARCVHPGWPMIRGWEAVRESWARIFDNTPLMQFAITDDEVTVSGDAAWVVCTENLTTMMDARVAESRVQTVNMFRREGDAWLLVIHHGSPVMR